MRILFIGDVVGSFGRMMIKQNLTKIKQDYHIDFVIANAENATHGKGLIRKHFEELLHMGIDVMTLGNHYQAQGAIRDYIADTISLIRPANLKKPFPGVGTTIYQQDGVSIRVTNLLGQAFMNEDVNNPFDILDSIIKKSEQTDIHIVDFHAEATGEKYAIGYAFDGKVTAVIGTHTHVQTADARLLPLGTAYITDVGMTGPNQGILGVKKETIIARLWKQEKQVFELADDGEVQLNAVILTIDSQTKKAIKIEPICLIDKVK
jgi:metallophosphoesterase (TIGR00282 family)